MPQSLGVQSVLLDNGFTGTIYPVWGLEQLPLELIASLCVEYNAEIDRGRSFPETHHLSLTAFEQRWFSGVSGVMVAGNNQQLTTEDLSLLDSSAFLGSFCIYPVYPGRSSHIGTANFLVKKRHRRRGVGMAMTQCFMRWAIQLGYDYALFNFVYDCNIGACRILNKLDFRVLTTIPGAGILKGFPHPVDAFIFGRPLTVSSVRSGSASGPGGSSVQSNLPGVSPHAGIPGSNSTNASTMSAGPSSIEVNRLANSASQEDRPSIYQQHTPEFQHLVHYLTHAKYPEGLSRTEHSRIRSRCRYYEIRNGVLVYKRSGAVVVSDPAEQHRIARYFHRQNHQGINKLVSLVLSQYYWLGVRESIMKATRECEVCNNGGETLRKRQALEAPLSLGSSGAVSSNGMSVSAVPTNVLSTSTLAENTAPLSSESTLPTLHLAVGPDPGTANKFYSAWPAPIVSDLPSDAQESGDTPSTVYSTPGGGFLDPTDTEKIIYLRPENEDSDYIPSDEAYDMGLNGRHQEFLDDDNNLFRDDDDEEWVGDEFEDPDDDDDEDDDMEDDEEQDDKDGADIEDA